MKKRSIIVIALFGAAALAVRRWAPEALEPAAAIAWLRGLGWLSVIAYVLGYAALTTLAVPAFAGHIVAGVTFGLPQGLFIAMAAAQLASNVQFWLGRALGAERVAAWFARRGWSARFEQSSMFGIFVIRVLPTPFVAVNVGAGASGMKWRHFFVGSGLGLVPHVVVHTVFAAQLYQGVEGAQRSALAWALGAGVVLVVAGAIGRWLLRRSNHGKQDLSRLL